MPRFMIELSGSTDFLKNMVANPVDRVSELTPVLQDMGITFEQRYYVVGENKAYDIVSGDSDAVQPPSVRRTIERSCHILHVPSGNDLR